MKLDKHGRFVGRRLRNDRFFQLILVLLVASVAWWSFDLAGFGPWRGAGSRTGHVQHDDLAEISGIVVSRRNPDVIWAHNDSGGIAAVFAMKTDGTHLGVFPLAGARAIDWEDIAIGPGPAPKTDYLYVADTGNNNLSRSIITVYRVPEPLLDGKSSATTRPLKKVETLSFRFPGSPHECETLLVDPLTGDLYFVSRDRSAREEETSFVFHAPAPHEPGIIRTLDLVTSFTAPAEIKGGDISPDGRMILLRPHSPRRQVKALLWLWERENTPLSRVFAEPNHGVPVRHEPQGEAIAFSADGQSYFTIGEGLAAPIYRYELSLPGPDR